MKKIVYVFFLFIVLFSLTQTDAANARVDKNPPHKQEPPNAAERQRAYLSLFNQKDVRHFPVFIQALRDPDPYVRYTGAWVLNPKNMDHMGRVLLLDGSEKEWISPLTPLISVKILTALLEALPEEDFWAREEIIEAVNALQEYQLRNGMSLDKRVRKTLLTQIKDPDPNIRYVAAQGLQLWGRDPITEKVFRQLLTNRNQRVRYAAVSALKWDFQVLQAALSSASPLIRAYATQWIYSTHSTNPLTLNLLITRLGDSYYAVRENAVRSLGRIKNGKAVKPLLALHAIYPRRGAGHAIQLITGKDLEEVIKEYKLEMRGFQLESPPIRIPTTRFSRSETKNWDRFEWITALQTDSLSQSFLSEKMETMKEAIKVDDELIKFNALEEHLLTIYPAHVIQHQYAEPEFDRIKDAAKHPNPHIRRTAIKALRPFLLSDFYSENTFTFVSELLHREEDPFLREALAYLVHEVTYSDFAFVKKHAKDIEVMILRFFNDEFHKIRRLSLRSRGTPGCSQETINRMLESLKDPYSSIRALGADQLGWSGRFGQHPLQIISALKQVAESDHSPRVRNVAKTAYKHLERTLGDENNREHHVTHKKCMP